MAGAGSISAGLGAYGVGTPATAPEVGGTILGGYSSRYINPLTGDYSYDENGRAVGSGSVEQIVQLAIMNELNSSASPGQGFDRAGLDLVTTGYENKVKSRVEAALKTAIDAGQVELLSVETYQNSNRRVSYRIRWKDLTTDAEVTTAL